MGEFPARICSADFVTPPEFADWKLPAEGAGRIGGVRMTISERQGVSSIAHLYEQIPVRAMPLDLGRSEPALIYLLNPTAGLLDGDAHGMEIHAGPNTRTVVTGQSATRIHPSSKGFCTQQWNVSVADGAILVILPGPAIPFAGCQYFQRIRVELAPTAQLIWGDLWFAGRYARQQASECFRFDCLIQDMQVRRAGQLVYRDRFRWHGPWNEKTAHWHFGEHPAAGSLFVTGPIDMNEMPVDAEISTAPFTTAFGDTCLRCTGSAEGVMRTMVENSLHMASRLADGVEDGPWLLRRHHLGRTHWFCFAEIDPLSEAEA